MRKAPLGELIEVDRVIAAEDECRAMPYVGLEHIEKESGRFSDDFRPKPESVLATKFRFAQKHVLYGKLRPYLNKVALPYFKGVCTTEILPLLPKPGKLERGFLYAVLLSPRFVSWASQNVSGANLPRLGPDRLLEYEFPLPDLAEQKRIAAILERADRLRRLRRYGLEMADDILPAVFSRLFGDPVTNPNEWPTLPLDEVASSRLGKMLDAKQQTGKHPRPYLRNENVQWDRFDLTDVSVMDFDEGDREEFLLAPGDLMICEGGQPGRCAIWRGEIGECYFQKALHRARPIPSKATPEYLLHLMWSLAQRGGFADHVTSATIAHLTGEKLKQMQVPVPALSLQHRLTLLVKRVAHLRSIHRESLRQAEHLFQALLERAFTSGL